MPILPLPALAGLVVVWHACSTAWSSNFQTRQDICLPARACERVCARAQAEEEPYKLYFYMSPYMRSKQTVEALAGVFREGEIAGFQEEVQLREQGAAAFLIAFCGAAAQVRSSPQISTCDLLAAAATLHM